MNTAVTNILLEGDQNRLTNSPAHVPQGGDSGGNALGF